MSESQESVNRTMFMKNLGNQSCFHSSKAECFSSLNVFIKDHIYQFHSTV